MDPYVSARAFYGAELRRLREAAGLTLSPSFPAVVPVRDSKLGAPPAPAFSRAGWAALVPAIKEHA